MDAKRVAILIGLLLGGCNSGSEGNQFAGKYVDLQLARVNVPGREVGRENEPVTLSLLVTPRQDGQLMGATGIVHRMVDDQGRDLMKLSAPAATTEPSPGISINYSTSAQCERGEYDLVLITSMRGPSRAARWIDTDVALTLTIREATTDAPSRRETIPLHLRVGVPPHGLASEGGTVEPCDLVPWEWKLPANAPYLNGAGTDADVAALDLAQPRKVYVKTWEFPVCQFWCAMEIRARSGRAIISLGTQVDRLFDDRGTNLLHQSPESSGTFRERGFNLKVRKQQDEFADAAPGDTGPRAILIRSGQWPAEKAGRIRLEGELTMVTAGRIERAESKLNLEALLGREDTAKVSLWGVEYTLRKFQTGQEWEITFVPTGGLPAQAKGSDAAPSRTILDLQLLDARRKPISPREFISDDLAWPNFEVRFPTLPSELILTGRLCNDVRRERAPLRLEWTNRWRVEKDDLQTTTAPADPGVRLDVLGWDRKPHSTDDYESRMDILLQPWSAKGAVRVQGVYWVRAIDSKGTDLLSDRIDRHGWSQSNLIDVENSPNPMITLMGPPASRGAKSIDIEVWLNLGTEDAPRWVPFRATVPIGLARENQP